MLSACAHISLTVTIPAHSDSILLQAPPLSLSPWVMGWVRSTRELISLPKITLKQRRELKNLIFLILWAGKYEIRLILSLRSPHQGLASFAQRSKLLMLIKVHCIGLISFLESFLSSHIRVSWSYLPHHILVPGSASWRNPNQDRLSTRVILDENTSLDLVLKLRSLSYSKWMSQAWFLGGSVVWCKCTFHWWSRQFPPLLPRCVYGLYLQTEHRHQHAFVKPQVFYLLRFPGHAVFQQMERGTNSPGSFASGFVFWWGAHRVLCSTLHWSGLKSGSQYQKS